jgi:dihydrofolate synthase/folylpolyglutamate synthase
LIDDTTLAALLEEIETVNAGAPITFFEVTTAAAFLAFARAQADYVLLETGMGGRLDATNLVEKPVAVGLTPISFDHMQYLGTTLAAIAGEKAGIVKPGVPIYVGVQPPEAVGVFDAKALALGAPLVRNGRDWHFTPTADGFVWRRDGRHYDLPLPALPGRHQIDNAALAVAIADGLGLPEGAIARGIASAQWPARLQRLTQGPLPDLLGPEIPLYLDGGHNEAAGEVLAAWAKGRKIDLVFGMLATKEPADFLRHVAPFVRRLRAIAIEDEPLSRPASDIVDAARTVGIADAAEAISPQAAIADLAAEANAQTPVLICGSLYLCGRILGDNS